MAAQMEAAASAGLPAAAADGTVTMTIHQVNGDGAGWVLCSLFPSSHKLTRTQPLRMRRVGRCIWQELCSDEGRHQRTWKELELEC